jgi:recombination protein RecA
VSHEQLHNKPHKLGITEDPNVLDGHFRHHEEQLVKIFKAVSEVFPGDPFPFDGLEHYRKARPTLDELDTQLPLQSGVFSNTELRAERGRLFRHAVELFEADLRLSRKQKLARMALSEDWSGMSSYVLEGVAIWKCRMMLRFGALFLGFGLPRFSQICETDVYREFLPPPRPAALVLARPQSFDDSDYRYSLGRRGVAITKDRASSVIRTGSLTLDEALRIGGFPRGRIVEIFGPESAGKTTLALAAAANVQKNGDKVAYFDNECKLDFPWARTLGLETDDALILRGTRAQDTLVSLLDIVHSGDFALVAVDTLAAFVPSEDLEGSDDRELSREMELLFTRALPRIASAASKTETCVLLLNQIRLRNDGYLFGKPTVSVGGYAVHHCSSIRLELTRGIMDKRGDGLVVGARIKGGVVKNCVAAPGGIAEWAINFERGLDLPFELIEQGLARGVIDRQTAALKFRDMHLGANNDAAREFLLQRPDVAGLLETQLRARMKRAAGAGLYYDSQ